MLIQAKETGEIRDGRPTKRSDDSTVSLSAIGLSKDHSSTAQQLAKLSEQVFEARIEATKETGEIKPHRHEEGFHEGTVKLVDIGVSKKQSHVTQQLA